MAADSDTDIALTTALVEIDRLNDLVFELQQAAAFSGHEERDHIDRAESRAAAALALLDKAADAIIVMGQYPFTEIAKDILREIGDFEAGLGTDAPRGTGGA